MSEEQAKGQRGRPSRWGKGDSDKAKIAADLANLENVTMYYVNKLIEKGLAKVILTDEGEKFLQENKA